MAASITADELTAYFALRAAGDRLQRAVAEQLREHGLTEVQFSILARLRDAGEVRMSDLARVLVTSKSGLTYQAAQLEGRGLLARRGSDADERSVLIRLEPAGVALLEQVLPGHVALVRALMLDRLSAGELRAIASGLGKVADG